MRLSVVVVNWNSRDDLVACLDSLRAQTHQDLEIVVVDNGSTDGSIEIVREKYGFCKLLEEKENLGFAEGCNRGIAATTAEWIATLNNDAIADRRWAETLVHAARTAPDDCGMLQSVMLFMDRPEVINSTGIALMDTGGGMDRHEGEHRSAASGDEEIFCPTAGAAAYRRKMLDEIRLPTGWFDRDHFMYYEDLDLGWRARLAGWSARLVPASVVHHRYHGSSWRFGPSWLAAISRTNRLRTLIKNASPRFLVRTLPRSLVEAGELLWYGGPKAAMQLPRALMRSLRQRGEVSAMAKERRESVEARWVDAHLAAAEATSAGE